MQTNLNLQAMIKKMISRNSISSAVRCSALILLSSLFYIRAAAQLDTFKIVFCDEMYFDEIVGMSIEAKGRTVQIPIIDKNTFVHPIKYVGNNDTTSVLVVELNKTILRLYGVLRFMQSSEWKLCLPKRRKYKKKAIYSYYNYYDGGYAYMGLLHYIEKDGNGKSVLSDEDQATSDQATAPINRTFKWRRKRPTSANVAPVPY